MNPNHPTNTNKELQTEHELTREWLEMIQEESPDYVDADNAEVPAHLVVDTDGETVATLPHTPAGARFARLFSGSPGLLTACKLALGRDDIADGELGNELRAAIADATGEAV